MVKKDEGGKGSAIPTISAHEFRDGCLSFFDDLKHFRPYEVFEGIVIG